VSQTRYPVPADDVERVAYLRDLAILDTESDPSLDRVVRMCASVFGVPTSVVSLVDEQRQWFKAIHGLDVCETDREVAFCNYTILGDEIFEICDASADPRFAQNPLVTSDLHLRYYAGCPIVVEGVTIGSLCLIDYEPRAPLTDDERRVFAQFCDIVVRELTLSKLLRESLALLAGN